MSSQNEARGAYSRMPGLICMHARSLHRPVPASVASGSASGGVSTIGASTAGAASGRARLSPQAAASRTRDAVQTGAAMTPQPITLPVDPEPRAILRPAAPPDPARSFLDRVRHGAAAVERAVERAHHALLRRDEIALEVAAARARVTAAAERHADLPD